MVEWMVGHLAASRVDWMVDWTVYSMDAKTVVHLAASKVAWMVHLSDNYSADR